MTQQDERNLTRNLLKGIYLFRRTAFLVALLYFIGAGFGAIYNPINTPANDLVLWLRNLILVKQVTHATYPIWQFAVNCYLFMFFVYAVDLLCFCLEQEALIEYRNWHFHMKYLSFKRRAIFRLKSKSRIYKFTIPALYSFS